MLPKKHKMSREDFAVQKKKVYEAHSPHFTLRRYEQPQNTTETRCAVIIPKKAVGQATDRNTLKRRVYQNIKKHTDLEKKEMIVVSAKKGAGALSSQEISKELKTLLGA